MRRLGFLLLAVASLLGMLGLLASHGERLTIERGDDTVRKAGGC
jgi:hypothetical protein